jgi:dienelactone hydrolase
MRIFWAVLLVCGLCVAPYRACADEFERQIITADVKPQAFTLPSPQPSGQVANDTIYFDYYPPQIQHRTIAGATTGKSPAVILLHQLTFYNVQGDPAVYMRQAAQYLAERGIAAVVITLPYHGRRAVRGMPPLKRFISGDANDIEQAFSQSVADVRAVTDWLVARPEIDAQKLACFGASLGAIVTHLAMGQDAQLRSGVALLGGGDLVHLKDQSWLVRLMLRSSAKRLSQEQTEALKRVDPVTYAKANQPRQVLMVQAARDMIVSPQSGESLWEALGKPPIKWIDTNHMALILSVRSSIRTSLIFFEAIWSGATVQEAAARSPQISVPTIKIGWLTGLDSRLTPAIQYQALTLGQRKHMSLLSGNLGLSGRGPFVGLAATATPFIDVGLGHRFGGQGLKPYASFHVVF